MDEVTEILEQIRAAWLEQIVGSLTRAESVRESFRGELNRFYDQMLLAVRNSQPALMEPLLEEWAKAKMETQTEVGHVENNLADLFQLVLLQTYALVRETLAEEQALRVLGALLPVLTHCLVYASTAEKRQQLEQMAADLRQARLTLERLEKSKSDFISVAAHELKTPLTLIDGYASMLPETLTKPEAAAQADLLLSGIRAGTRRLREIVDDMIDVSLIDNNLLSLNYQPVWPNQLLGLLRRELKTSLRERKMNLQINPFPGSDEMIFADGERLLQALRNIVTNAVKYTPDGGKIVIDGRLLPGFIEITVADTGIGIAPENQQRIFEKFGRVGNVSLHSSGKTKFKGGGPGLGLAIAKGIIEAHGGSIWVESQGYDEARCPGSTFHLLLPVRKSPPDEAAARIFEPLIAEEFTETP